MADEKKFEIRGLMKNWKAILAVMAVFILVFELFAMGILGSGSILGKPQEKQVYGETEFEGSIRTYEPFLFIQSKEQLGGAMMNEIKELPGVKQLASEAGGTLIYVETRDDVYPVALALKKRNITTYSLANIAAPAEVAVLLENGQVINASWSGLALRVETQPIIPLDSTVKVKMVVLVENNRVVQYGSALLKTEKKTLSFEGEVQKEKIRQVFYIPWEERDSLDTALLENTTFYYEKNDLATFSEELPLEKIIIARQLDYIVYIDKKSAVFAENFTDAERAEEDLGVSLVFQPSLLSVETDKELVLPYNGTRSYLYEINVSSPEYYLPDELKIWEIENPERIQGQKINLSATLSTIGTVILSIENITLSS